MTAKSSKYNNGLMTLFMLLCDYTAVLLAEECAYYIRNTLVPRPHLHIPWANWWLVFPLIYVGFLHINRLYSRRRPFYKEAEKLFYASAYGTISIILLLYVGKTAVNTSRLFIGLLGIFTYVFLLVIRYAVKSFLIHRKLLSVPLLIIGAGKTAALLVKCLTADAGMGYEIVGLLEDNSVEKGILENYPVLGGFADAERVITETGVKNAFIAAPGLDYVKQGELIYRIQPLLKEIGIVPNLVGVPTGSVEVEKFYNERLLLLGLHNNLARPLNRTVKTVFDYALTSVGTVLVSPILAAIAVWIYVDSPGPVIFKHTRVGMNGKPFKCYKFRTMCVDAQEKLEELLENDPQARAEWEKEFKLKHDPRVTRSGTFLRRTSLDELPQIFNVLKGEMSLVGPRPVIDEELGRYGKFSQDYLMVRPGITGMWQVSGRSDTTYEERVMMDSWYVRNWSVWIDMVLLFRTFKTVFSRKGAY